MNKLKIMSLTICCLVVALWAEIQGSENPYDHNEYSSSSNYDPRDVNSQAECFKQNSEDIGNNYDKKIELDKIGKFFTSDSVLDTRYNTNKAPSRLSSNIGK